MNSTLYRLRHAMERVALFPMRELNDLWAMQALSPLSPRYVPWTRLALRPAGIVAVLNEIVINRRLRIVECGGGISTIYVGRLLKERGEGHLHTIEHDEAWAGYLRRQLKEEGLDRRVSVTSADLVPIRVGTMTAVRPWYDRAQLEAVTAEAPIDLLVVDGPPAEGSALQDARYPALPVFRELFAEDFTVILDDINRLGEQEVLRRWESEVEIGFQRRFARGRIAVGRSGESFET